MGHLARIERIAMRLPEAVRVDIEPWGGMPTFRVRKKNFVLVALDGRSFNVKLPPEEAQAVLATEPGVEPMGVGMGKHGWIWVPLPARVPAAKWDEVEEWIRTSYTLVAPKALARVVLDEDGVPPP